MDSTWDARPNPAISEKIAHYKERLQKEMSPVIGQSAENILSESRVDNILANVLSDMLKEEAEKKSGKAVDFALLNIGGIRSNLPAGDITIGRAFEILPFTNTLCLMKMRGEDVRELFEQIAHLGGEGVSNGARLEITKSGQLLSAEIGGKPLRDEAIYSVATIDYLAEGNDGMPALAKGEDKTYPPACQLRDLFIDWVKTLSAEGKMVTPHTDQRIIVTDK